MTGNKNYGRRHYGKRNVFRLRLWAAMRVEKKFSRSDLLRLATQGEPTPGEERSVTEYLTALHRAGYLRLIRQGRGTGAPTGARGGGGGVQSRYLLYRDTGPLHPRYSKRRKVVHDANTREEFPTAQPGNAQPSKEPPCAQSS